MLQYIDMKGNCLIKKILFLLIILLCLTGCSTNYTISYKDNIYSESLEIFQDTENEMNNNEPLNETFNYYYNYVSLSTNYYEDLGDYDSISNYNKELTNQSLYLKYNFTEKSTYKQSKIINNLFSNIIISEDIIRATNSKNIYDNYPSLNNITIKFVTDKKVLETNADKVENNAYYWNINKENYKDKNINIKLENNEINDNNNKEYVKDGYLTNDFLNYIFIFIGIIFLIVILIVYSKIKTSNKKW